MGCVDSDRRIRIGRSSVLTAAMSPGATRIWSYPSTGRPREVNAVAEEMGEIASDVRILKWMVGVVIALLLAGFTVVTGALFQISLRLPAS